MQYRCWCKQKDLKKYQNFRKQVFIGLRIFIKKRKENLNQDYLQQQHVLLKTRRGSPVDNRPSID